jgi:hypothetical protein
MEISLYYSLLPVGFPLTNVAYQTPTAARLGEVILNFEYQTPRILTTTGRMEYGEDISS